jgi:CO/xanthine dehydrogenase Mo-binding subunit
MRAPPRAADHAEKFCDRVARRAVVDQLDHVQAGEPSSRPMAGAIANAFFDATGVRLRRAPFTAERVKAALA